MVADFAISIGFECLALDFSPVKGPEGNIEYLIHLQKHTEGSYEEMPFNISDVVNAAHDSLDK
jgi:23S rRNA (cytidine1920-2'-O)/16S rRNA (cytidine1409-2'-O)-methyltransferase